MHPCQHPPLQRLRPVEVEVSVLSVQTGPQVNTTVHPAVTAARASSGGAFATTTRTTAGEFHRSSSWKQNFIVLFYDPKSLNILWKNVAGWQYYVNVRLKKCLVPGSTGSVLWTKTNETSVVTAGCENVSGPGWEKKVRSNTFLLCSAHKLFINHVLKCERLLLGLKRIVFISRRKTRKQPKKNVLSVDAQFHVYCANHWPYLYLTHREKEMESEESTPRTWIIKIL